MDYSPALKDYTAFAFDDGRWMRTVYRRGSGPAVIIIHEMPGLHPLVVRFADRVAAAGMTVFLPTLFGTPGRPVSMGYTLSEMFKSICIRREFNVWHTGKSSPIVDWLRALAKKVHGECGGKGVGAIGMCFTGGYALAMMTEPSVVAPVLSQPSMPMAAGFEKTGGRNRRLARRDRLRQGPLRERRPHDDRPALLRRSGRPRRPLRHLQKNFGKRFEAIEIDPKDATPGPMAPHSVLTINLEDLPGTPTKLAEERVHRILQGTDGRVRAHAQNPRGLSARHIISPRARRLRGHAGARSA